MSDIHDLIEYNEKIIATEKERQARFEQMDKEVLDESVEEFVAQIIQRYREIIQGAIDDFYADYSPMSYYPRRYSMENVPEVVRQGNDLIIKFHYRAMTFRDGYDGYDGLYFQTFRQGWHGGADKGPGHPKPGTPYWRAGNNFSRWGEPAAVAGEAPYDQIQKEVRRFDTKEAPGLFDTIWDAKFRPAVEKFEAERW